MFVSFQQTVFELGNFTGFKAFLPAGRTHKLKRLWRRVYWKYIQLPLRRTPLGPAVSVRLREMSVL